MNFTWDKSKTYYTPIAISLISLLLGIILILSILLFPSQTLFIFWKIILPAAPLIIFMNVKIWRLLCPMGSLASLKHQLTNFNEVKKPHIPSNKFISNCRYIGLSLFFLIPPLRPIFIDKSPTITIALFIISSLVALILSFIYYGRGAFCNGICPIHFIEIVYGQNKDHFKMDTKCIKCFKCTQNCIDINGENSLEKLQTDESNFKLYKYFSFALPGYILAWFTSTEKGATISSIMLNYSYVLTLSLISFAIFKYLESKVENKIKLSLVCGNIALIIYYTFVFIKF